MPKTKKPQICYKAVNVQDGKMVSFYKPSVEYQIGVIKRQKVKSNHRGGLYTCSCFDDALSIAKTKPMAIILECKYQKPIINEYLGKFAVSAIIPLRILGFTLGENYIPVYDNGEWAIKHLTKYPKGVLPPLPFELIIDGSCIMFDDALALKKGEIKKGIKEFVTLSKSKQGVS